MIPGWVQALAIIAPVVVGFGVAFLTNRSQRHAAREDRIGDKRADAYVKLAAHGCSAAPVRPGGEPRP